MDITSSEAVPLGGRKSSPLGGPRIKAAPSGASSCQCSTSFARPPSTHGVMLALTAFTEIGASAIFSCIGATNASLPSKPPLKPPPAPCHPEMGSGVVVGGAGGGGGVRWSGHQLMRVWCPNTRFLPPRDHQILNSGTKPGLISYIISIQHPPCMYRVDYGRQFLERASFGGCLASPRFDGDAAATMTGVARTC
jgi:hypothetical protein